MSYCINPKCPNRQNSEELSNCQSCGTSLLIADRYRIVRPLREPNPAYPTDIFEVKDWGNGDEDWGSLKVLKVLKYSNNPDLVRLFKKEARVLMWLRHQGIPRVEPDGYFTVSPSKRIKQLHCLVMEKIEGQNLEQWIEEHDPILEDQALQWLRQLAVILDQLHSKSLFHRDIKPSNLIVRPNGHLALIDFGTIGDEDSRGTRVGTCGYAAPEQTIGEAVPQSDFFALGRTFVHLVTGLSPLDFPESPTTGQLVWRGLAKQISPPVANFIDELMAPGYEYRPQNTQNILDRLETITLTLKSPPPNARKWNLKLVALLLLGWLAVGILYQPARLYINSFISPKLAKKLAEVGFTKFKNLQLESAEFYFRWALKFNPDYGSALYNLGWVCEEQGNLDCASKNYHLAIEKGGKKTRVYAINNLARLQIWKDGEYGAAVELIDKKGLNLAQYTQLKDDVKSVLHKNLGWALLEQNRYEEAETHLREAIALDSKSAASHCLLGRLLEAKGDKIGAIVEWKNCLRYEANKYNPETITWQGMARERLEPRGQKK